MEVRKTNDQGLYNKPSAAVHPGALDAGTLLQYNTIQYTILAHKHSVSSFNAGAVFPNIAKCSETTAMRGLFAPRPPMTVN